MSIGNSGTDKFNFNLIIFVFISILDMTKLNLTGNNGNILKLNRNRNRDFRMVNWQITAKTIYCESVKEEVTVIVKKDWSINCTGYNESAKSSGTKVKSGKKKSFCEGISCSRITRYKESLMQEENQ
jgi:hypothetical protein